MNSIVNESLERLAPSAIRGHLMVLDRNGAGYTTCQSWSTAYAFRAWYEEKYPGVQFCIRHTDCLIY